MDIDDIVKYLEGKAYGSDFQITRDGQVISSDFIMCDFDNGILEYDFYGAYSGKIDLYKVAEKIMDKYHPKSFDDLEKHWDNILSEYFSFGDY